MAKKENKTEQGEQKQHPVHPDSKQETIVVRYPLDGRVAVVSHMEMENNRPSLTTVEPSGKNQALFYEKTDSRFVANFFSTMRTQASAEGRDTKTVPEIYVVPYSQVGMLGAELLKLQRDPKDEDALAFARMFRTSTQALSRIIYDRARMPIDELAAAGFDVKKMEEEGAFADMELGKDSKLYPITGKLGEHISSESYYSLRPSFDENGDIRFMALSALPVPEFVLDETLRMEINGQEREDLRSGKTLDRVIKHDGEYCYAAFNRLTQRMIYVPCKDVQIPTFINNTRLNAAQMDELSRGGRALIQNCHYNNSDNKFSGHAQFDVHRMDFIVDDPRYERPYIPEHIAKSASPEILAALMKYEEVDGRQLRDRNGRPYTFNIRINPATNAPEFIRYQRDQNQQQEQGQNQGQRQATAEERPDPEQSQAPDMIPELPEQGQSRGRKM